MSSSSAELIETAGRLLVGSDLTVNGTATVNENAFLKKDLVVGDRVFAEGDIVGGARVFAEDDIVGGARVFAEGDIVGGARVFAEGDRVGGGSLTVGGFTVCRGSTYTFGTNDSTGNITTVGSVNAGGSVYATNVSTRSSVDVATSIIARDISDAGAYFGYAPSLTGVMPWARFIGSSTNAPTFGNYIVGVTPYYIPVVTVPLPTVSVSTGFKFNDSSIDPPLPTGFYLIEGYLNRPSTDVNAESIMTTVRWDGTRLWGCSASQYFTLSGWTTDFDCIETGQGFGDYDQAKVEVSYSSTKGTIIPPTIVPGVPPENTITTITMNVYKLADYGQTVQPLPPAPIIPAPPTIPPVPVPPQPPSPPSPPSPPTPVVAQQPVLPGFVARKKPKPMPMGPIPQ